MIQNRYSNTKIVWFPEKLQSFKEKIITAPICIRIKPTNRCCHNCYFCVYNSSFSKMHDTMSRKDELSTDKLVEIIRDIKEMGVKSVIYSGGGEPLLHKGIKIILNETIRYNLDLALITNGQLITSNLYEDLRQSKWIRISMDYYDEESFIRSNRGNAEMYNSLLDNIRQFTKNKGTCELGINFIITKDNYRYLDNAIRMASYLRSDNIRFSPLWVPNFVEYHKPLEDKVLEDLYLFGSNIHGMTINNSYRISEEVKTRKYSKCYFQQIVPVIAADYNVYTCHNNAYSPAGLIGSIKDKKFSDLWFSNETKEFFDNFNPEEKCLHQCANDSKNILLNDILSCSEDNYV